MLPPTRLNLFFHRVSGGRLAGQALGFCISVLAISLPLSAEGLRWEELAATGNAVPDYPEGGTFSYFLDTPLIGTERTLYRGGMSTPSSSNLHGFWYRDWNTGGDVLSIAGKELPNGAPAGSYLFTSTFSFVTYGPNASVAATAGLWNGSKGVGPITSANDGVIITPEFPATGARIQAREGDPAGFSGWTLDSWDSRSLAVNSHGLLSFKGKFAGEGTDYGNVDNIWTTVGSSQPLVRQGYTNDTVPGYSGDEYFVWFGGNWMEINSSGLTAYGAATFNRSPGADETRRLLLRGGGVDREITNEAMTPPGFLSHITFNLDQPGQLRLTGGLNPKVVFGANGHVWRWHDGTMEAVTSGRETSSPAGLSVSPVTTNFAVGSTGQVAMLANLFGPGITSANNRALVLEDFQGPGSLVVRYQEGDHLPGMPAGSVVTNFEVPSLSDGGRLAFVATYDDNGTTRTGLWVEAEGLRHICSTGDYRRGSDGVIREISDLYFYAGGHYSPLDPTAPCGWNDDTGHAVLRVRYTDGQQAIWQVELDADLTPMEMIDNATVAAGLSGDDALLTAEPFNDGVPNLLKYAFNMNLASPDASTMAAGGASGLPRAALVEEAGQSYWQVEYLVRKDSGLVYTPKKSTTLEPESFVEMVGEVTEADIDGEWKRVTVMEPCDPATETKCFSHLEVTLP